MSLRFSLEVLHVQLLDLESVQVNAVEYTYVDGLYSGLLISQLIDDRNAARRAEGMSGSLGGETIALKVFLALNLYILLGRVEPKIGILSMLA